MTRKPAPFPRHKRPCPDGQHRPATRDRPPLGAPLPTCPTADQARADKVRRDLTRALFG
jgi:hypothetical protein